MTKIGLLQKLSIGVAFIAATSSSALAQNNSPISDSRNIVAKAEISPRASSPSAALKKAAGAVVTTAPFTLDIDKMPSGGTALDKAEADVAEGYAEMAKKYKEFQKPYRAGEAPSTITGTVIRGEGYTIYRLGDPSDARAGTMGVHRLAEKLRAEAPKGQEPIITTNYYYETRPGVKSKNSELQDTTLEKLTVVLAEDSIRPLVFISAPALRKGADGKLIQLHYGAMKEALDNENGLGPQRQHKDYGNNTIIPLAVTKGANGQTEEGFAVGLLMTKAQAKKEGLPESEGHSKRDMQGSLAVKYDAIITDSNKALIAAAKKAEAAPAVTTAVASLNKD